MLIDIISFGRDSFRTFLTKVLFQVFVWCFSFSLACTFSFRVTIVAWLRKFITHYCTRWQIPLPGIVAASHKFQSFSLCFVACIALQFICPFHSGWNGIVVQYASHLKWNFRCSDRDQLAWKRHFSLLYSGTYNTICLAFIQHPTRAYGSEDFRSVQSPGCNFYLLISYSLCHARMCMCE